MKMLSNKQQLLLLYLFEHFMVRFEEQNIFKNKLSFYRSIEELVRVGLVDRSFIDKNKFMTTRRGELVARELYRMVYEK